MRKRTSPKSKTSTSDILEEIVETLRVSRGKREECRNRVMFYIEPAKARSEFHKKNERHPGVIKRKADALYKSLRKTQDLAKEIEPLFSAVFDDSVEYDARRGYAAFEECLKTAIAISNGIARRIDIPHGSKQKDYDKYEAKSIAITLVGQYATYVSEPALRQQQNDIASLLYELLTGLRDADLPKSADAYRPPFLKTRGAIKVPQDPEPY